MRKKIVVAGGTGFIGSVVTEHLIKDGYSVVILTRGKEREEEGKTYLTWDGDNVQKSWANGLENAFAIINLSGEPINKRFTAKNKRAIISSRVNSVHALAKALNLVNNPPKIWIQGSAIGYYGNTGDEAADEYSPRGDTFLSEVVEYWERSFIDRNLPEVRKVIVRIGQVLGNGGMLSELTRLTNLYLGGAIGNGKKWESWIHIKDLSEIFVDSITRERMGIYNAVAPNPVTNKEFMATLRKVMLRPWAPPVPKIIARIGGIIMGIDSELIFSDTKCYPKRLIEDNFPFKFTLLKPALENILLSSAENE